MKKLRIAYFGTPAIAVPPLETLVSMEDVEVVFVGVFPDKPVGRKKALTPCPVKAKALDLNLKTREIKDQKDLEQAFREEDFDLALVIAFGMIFPETVFGHREIINVHFSSLPQYRGASPVQSAILKGDNTLGITFQRMVPTLDAGDILWHQSYDITDLKTSEVWSNFSRFTAQELPSFLTTYAAKELAPAPQQESEVTFCGKFKKEEGLVDLHSESPEIIYRKYRAFDVWPGVFIQTPKGQLKLKSMYWKKNELKIERVQLEGKSEMSTEDFLRGYPDLGPIISGGSIPRS